MTICLKGLRKGINMVKFKFKWETEFKQTEIGEIPREWEM